MIMLKQIPTTAHLGRMYYELARIGASCAGENNRWPYEVKAKEELIALACDMSRHDPRLFDILVEYFVRHWQDVNPASLRNYYKSMKTPQTVAVICEFLAEAQSDDEAQYFASYVSMGLGPVATQFYFHNLYSPGGSLARRAAEEGLSEYKKWGFLACERPTVDIAERRTKGSFDATSRRNILKRVLNEKREITIGDYLSALSHSISRQQALLDIKTSGFAKSIGSGRGAKWRLVAA